jgi:hypothetical protein
MFEHVTSREVGETTRRSSGEAFAVPLGRRAFLGRSLLLVGGVALARVPALWADSGELAAFVRLSRVASGTAALPAGLARQYLEALDAAPLHLTPSRFVRLAGFMPGPGPASLAELKTSAAYRAAGGRECVDAVAAAWWSGIVPTTGSGQRVVTFTDALVWKVVHEPTTCQGAVGSWSTPGRAVE